jgi:23S rRNA pseudouridine2605 synthase
MGKRLSKALAAAGVASRRACEGLIESGRVTVNGAIVRIPQTLVDWEKDVIKVNGKAISGEEDKVYFLLHKPAGYLCTNVRLKGGAKVVLDLFSHLPHRLFTVGRLDQDTTGLIIVTNDGSFANRIIHPSYNVLKEYLVKTSQEVTDVHLKTISAGTLIEGVHVVPVSVKKVRRGTLKVVVGEGKKHEVRQLLARAELTVRELCRIRIGSLKLDTLPLGHHRPLSRQEIEAFL